MSSDNDKRELLKLKQGLIEKSDAIDEDGYDVKMPETAGAKAKNWFGYHIIILILAVVIIAIGVVIYFAFFNKPKADIKIYSTSYYTPTMCDFISGAMAKYTKDLNGDGITNIEIETVANDTALSVITLYNEIDGGRSSVYIGTFESLSAIYDDILAADNKELFCDLTGIADGVEGYAADIRKTEFGKRNQIFSTEMYIAVKKTDDKAMEQSLEFVKNLCTGQSYM